MAIIYCKSTRPDDTGDGLTWALAKKTLAAALTAAGVGGTVYVSQAHAETQASAMTPVSPGTAAAPVRIICVNDAAEPPTTVATTATITTTGAFNITFSGFAYVYGVTFSVGTGAVNASLLFSSLGACWWRFEDCGLKIPNTGSTSSITFGGGSVSNNSFYECINCTFVFGHVSQAIYARTRVKIKGGSLGAGIIPTNLFIFGGSVAGSFEVSDMDLSLLGSGKSVLSVTAAIIGTASFDNCKIGASAGLAFGATPGQGCEARFVNCDSADTNYRYHKQTYAGTINQETVITLAGGASDGTTFVSNKLVTTANTKFGFPLESDPIVLWNEILGSPLTATIEVITDNVTLTDADAWLEAEYAGTSGSTKLSLISDRAASILATPANQTTSTAGWTTTGLTTPVKQKLTVSFTPQEKGPVSLRVMLARASTTMYFDFDPRTVIA